MKLGIVLIIFIYSGVIIAQDKNEDSPSEYKKRVLESAEIDILSSYYSQDGSHAAVTGGKGSEKLTDFTPTIVFTVPLNDDNVLSVEAGISAYTSASSSNLNPFDGNGVPDAFVTSSGASQADQLIRLITSFSHSSDDRNSIWTANLAGSKEYDYTSFGLGGSYTKLWNEKNTELSLSGNVFIDSWNPYYPIELEAFANGGIGGDDDDDDESPLFNLNQAVITGNTNYIPSFTEFTDESRNSYSLGLGFSQIISSNLQASFSLDLVLQDGLLSSPLQRVYFSDVEASFVEGFRLADAVETLPDSRFKIAIGGRLHYYINERFVLRSNYRYYTDDWGIRSFTAGLEIPIKITDNFTVYPSYRYYTQTEADYFAPFAENVSSQQFFTSDFDLSDLSSNQYGMGIEYKTVFPKFGIKSINIEFNQYERSNTDLSASIISFGIKFSL